MSSLKNLFKEVRDPNDYDGAAFIAIKDGAIATFGFTGEVPKGMDQRMFLYKMFSESCFALAFNSGIKRPDTPPSDAPRD